MKTRLALFLSLAALAFSGCTAVLTEKTVGRPLTQTEVQPFLGKWSPSIKEKASLEVFSRKDGSLSCIQNEKDKTSTWDVVVTTMPEHDDSRIAWIKFTEDKTADGPWTPCRILWSKDNPNVLGLLMPNETFIDEQAEKGELEVTKRDGNRLVGAKKLEATLLDHRFWDLDQAGLFTRMAPSPRRPDRKR
jgi:hypothetical protein